MTSQGGRLVNWSLFIALCIIWGSSFILMKEGLKTLNAFQVAAVRMVSAGIILLPVGIRQFKNIPKNKIGLILLSAVLGSVIPAFLFCIAETKIDSSLAGFINSFTPIFTIICGVFFFRSTIKQEKIAGILIGFVGMILLFLANDTINLDYISYAMLALIAAFSYGFNINMVNRYLKEIGSTNIAAIGFTLSLIPSLIILIATGYFSLPLTNTDVLLSTGAGCALGFFGTALATILFYILLKRAGPLFSSTVPYGIPFVALFWGVLAGERINIWQITGLIIILAGVYMTNRK